MESMASDDNFEHMVLQVGNWSRWLSDMLGMDNDNPAEENQHSHKEECQQGGDSELKSFVLLNELSELLMLPKDLLLDRSIRKEVRIFYMASFGFDGSRSTTFCA